MTKNGWSFLLPDAQFPTRRRSHEAVNGTINAIKGARNGYPRGSLHRQETLKSWRGVPVLVADHKSFASKTTNIPSSILYSMPLR